MKVEPYKLLQLEFYTEGPAMDSNGNLYCTTLMGGYILKLGKEPAFSVWGSSPCPNGQVILPNGDHLVCDSRQGLIARYNRDGVLMRNEINKRCGGFEVYVPNDLVVDHAGGIYFTDSIRKEGKIGYRSIKGDESILATGLDYPNGLALSQDEKVLFVAESYQNRIIAIPLQGPGRAEGRLEVIARLPVHFSGEAINNLPDGIAIDNANNIWVAHYGMQAVQVVSPVGELIQSIEIPFPLVSNVLITNSGRELIVTGGYVEPGPGAVCWLNIS